MITALEVFIERRARLGAAGDVAEDSAGAVIVTNLQRRNERYVDKNIETEWRRQSEGRRRHPFRSS
jgi:hypothetical protein